MNLTHCVMKGNTGVEGLGLYSNGAMRNLTMVDVDISGHGGSIGGAMKITGNTTLFSELDFPWYLTS